MNSSQRPALSGLLLAAAGAVAFSGKAIIVKLSYVYGVDAVTVIIYRMFFALPFCPICDVASLVCSRCAY